MIAVTLAAELLLMNAIGACLRWKGMVDKEFSSRLTNLILNICVPCLIFQSINNAAEFSAEALKNCMVVLVLGVVAVAVPLLAGHLIYLATGKSGMGRNIRYGLTFYHFSFMGIPVIAELFGDMGIFYYTFFLIPVRIGYYGLSEQLMTPPGVEAAGGSPWKKVKGAILNPQFLAVVVSLIFWVSGWKLPTAIGYCVKSLQSICSPLALLLCGMVIAEHDVRALAKLKYIRLPLIKTVAVPAVFFLLSRLLLTMGVEPMLCQILVIYAALPVASLLPVYSVKYDPDPNNHLDAAGASILSVLLSAITIPVWYLLIT